MRSELRTPTAADMNNVIDEQAIRRHAVQAFAAELRDGLDQLPRDDLYGTLIRPGDVADLVARLLLEVA